MSSVLSSWNLKDLLRHPMKDFQRLQKELETKVAALEGQRKHLSSEISSQGFQRILKQVEDITESMNILGAYAFLWFAENTKNQTARAFDNQVQSRLLPASCGQNSTEIRSQHSTTGYVVVTNRRLVYLHPQPRRVVQHKLTIHRLRELRRNTRLLLMRLMRMLQYLKIGNRTRILH